MGTGAGHQASLQVPPVAIPLALVVVQLGNVAPRHVEHPRHRGKGGARATAPSPGGQVAAGGQAAVQGGAAEPRGDPARLELCEPEHAALDEEEQCLWFEALVAPLLGHRRVDWHGIHDRLVRPDGELGRGVTEWTVVATPMVLGDLNLNNLDSMCVTRECHPVSLFIHLTHGMMGVGKGG